MDRSKTISNIIKLCIVIGLFVISIVLLAQYIAIAQLNAKQQKLSTELETATQEYTELSSTYESISQNYEEYVEDYMRDNYDYVDEGEVIFNK